MEKLLILNEVDHYYSIKSPKKRVQKNFDEEYDSIIESINDNNNYLLKENEKKYKIFEDISYINNHDRHLELILDLPINLKINSINKIKFSNKIKNYIEKIFISVNKKEVISDINSINLLNIHNVNELELHIILRKNAINHLLNQNIYITYSYIDSKPKLKFY